MKKLIAILLVGAASLTVGWSQAVINFANGAVGVNAPVTNFVSGVPVSGTAWAADLFYGTTSIPNSLTLSQLTDTGLAQTFQTGPAAGYWNSLGIELPVTGQIEFIVVVWQTAAGATWAEASGGGAGDVGMYFDNGGTLYGLSTPITVTPNTFPSPNSNLQGLQPFAVGVVIPEPTTWAVGVVGGVVLFLFRCRK